MSIQYGIKCYQVGYHDSIEIQNDGMYIKIINFQFKSCVYNTYTVFFYVQSH